jgi:hypothetical protein
MFDIDFLGLQFIWQHQELDLFLYSGETLVAGVLGGLYAGRIGRRAGPLR